MTRPHVALLALAITAAAGCGSSTSHPASTNSNNAAASSKSTATAPSPPTLPPNAMVKAILPREWTASRLLKLKLESLKQQLAPAGTRGKAHFDALVRRTWVTSGHSIFQPDTLQVAITVDVNVFRSASAAERVYHLETILKPAGIRQVVEHVPAGAPYGSSYDCEGKQGYSGCTLTWRQGALIAYVQLLGKGPSAFNPGVADRLGPQLARWQGQIASRIYAQTRVPLGGAPASSSA